MASKVLYWTTIDTEHVIGAQLALDGVTADLSASTLVCRMVDLSDDSVVIIPGVAGGTDGMTSTEFTAAHMIAGRHTLEWFDGEKVYPGDANRRIQVNIRKVAI